jgi:hypothetical protein
MFRSIKEVAGKEPPFLFSDLETPFKILPFVPKN